MQARVAADTETDEGLMLAWQAGDAAAFDRLYARHRGGVFRYLLRHCGNRASAEELHQDVWLRLISARPGYRPVARFTTWLYTVARNRLIDHWRAAAPQRLVSLDVEQDDGMVVMQFEDPAVRADPMRNADSWQQGRRIVDALQALPGAQRDAFLLHVEGGLALTEIAALTGAPAETVKSRLRYAYARLRDALGDLQ
jgi:RNA polymerase sigma-70 factor (ECF subfamily)